MNRITEIIILFCLHIVFLQAQDYMITDPFQLAVKHSTARLANASYAGSALSQAFFRDNYDMHFTLYMPGSGLTDADVRGSSLRLLSPSFSWGAFAAGYTDFTAENLSEPVFSHKRMQLGYSNMFFNSIVLSLQAQWHKYTWFSENYANPQESGLSVDADLIYIIDGYNSLGLSFNNLLAPSFSSYAGDHPAQTLNLSYLHSFKNGLVDLEGGITVAEDYLMETTTGLFFNSAMHFNKKFKLTAEYSHSLYNTLGVALNYSFSIDSWHTQLIYGFAIDDSPLPMASFKHALGISISLNQWRIADKQINPQFIYRDDQAPQLQLQRLSEFTVFRNDDASDILQIKISAEDDLSGLDVLQMEISAEKDSNRVLYTTKRSVSATLFSDTLEFHGYDSDNEFLENGIYHARIIAADNSGNISRTSFVPFRILSYQNDSLGPDIRVAFDSSTVVMAPGERDLMLNAQITIDEQSSASVRWTIHLFKSTDDSSWISQKEVTGIAEVYDHNFQWLLRKNRRESIAGKYKLKVEAYDELDNYTGRWSAIKTIVDTVSLLSKRSDRDEQPDKEAAEPAIVYIPQALPDNPETILPQRKRLLLQAAYQYKNREVTLTDFTFVHGERMNINENQQSLSLIGFYLQDIPGSTLTVEYPDVMDAIPDFKKDLYTFFKDSFGIAPQRIKLIKKSSKRFYFKIKE